MAQDAVETDVYRALRNRIGLFESVVGRLQPILAQMPRTISAAVLSGSGREDAERARVVDTIEQQTREAEGQGFDIDAVTESDLAMPARTPSPVTMEDLDRVIGSSDLMPPGTDVQPMGRREYGLLAPGMTERLPSDHRPGVFRGARRKPGTVVPRKPSVYPSGVHTAGGPTASRQDVEGYPGRLMHDRIMAPEFISKPVLSKKHKRTPAMQAGLTTRRLTFRDIFLPTTILCDRGSRFSCSLGPATRFLPHLYHCPKPRSNI